ncbi:MAG TPA: acylneuraminate cytidylyltransferase family protein [Candidatus Sulfotelmatobacter sp.]|jgi:N-acylneuraminate cytidylyltransferase|nr:acylneuraminate cytidylyltransferase family protein [Candidatus Sulfotelmatobacter sp.]
MSSHSAIAIIPARGGSKGLPGKNVRLLGGMPLIAHSIRLAQLCPGIGRCIVTTDNEEIAKVAREAGGEVPFLRPPELAADATPMLPVLRHAIREMEAREGKRYELVVLLQPTSPFRLPEDVSQAIEIMEQDPDAVGVVAVSVPAFNPRVVCVEEKGGYLRWAFDQKMYTRRQDAESVYRVNGMLYVWRRDYLMRCSSEQLYASPHRILIVPEERALDIDTLHDFQVGEALFQAGMLQLPWCDNVHSTVLERS